MVHMRKEAHGTVPDGVLGCKGGRQSCDCIAGLKAAQPNPCPHAMLLGWNLATGTSPAPQRSKAQGLKSDHLYQVTDFSGAQGLGLLLSHCIGFPVYHLLLASMSLLLTVKKKGANRCGRIMPMAARSSPSVAPSCPWRGQLCPLPPFLRGE